MLKVENLEKNFGGLQAVRGCNFEVEAGRITGLIGPNGAGKTTIFNMIAGAERPSGGRIVFEGEDIAGLPTHTLFHRGILRTFQIPHEFGKLTVLENLMVVPPGQSGESLLRCWLSAGGVARQEAEVRARAETVVDDVTGKAAEAVSQWSKAVRARKAKPSAAKARAKSRAKSRGGNKPKAKAKPRSH